MPPCLLPLAVVVVAPPPRPRLHDRRDRAQHDGRDEQAPQCVLVPLYRDGLLDAAQPRHQRRAAEQTTDELLLARDAALGEAAGEAVGEQAGEDAAADGGAEGAREAAEGGDERGQDEVGLGGHEVQGVDEGVVDGGAGGEAVEEGEDDVEGGRGGGCAGLEVRSVFFPPSCGVGDLGCLPHRGRGA